MSTQAAHPAEAQQALAYKIHRILIERLNVDKDGCIIGMGDASFAVAALMLSQPSDVPGEEVDSAAHE